ncbi:uncharacterized protein [Littorina saxatilis]|uniref:uncharacterized protein n=1 Tax=Littorina saxatilis TaxID=31220 RepID=UPI0038B548D5
MSPRSLWMRTVLGQIALVQSVKETFDCRKLLRLKIPSCVVSARSCSSMSGAVEDYKPPEWATKLTYIPKKRIHLAVANTPIHTWKVPGLPADFSVSIKRDDLTGSTLSGNKVRKLEFLMADALEQGCRHVITCGGLQSNHCRAVALAARQLGLTPHLFLRTDATDVKSAGCEGNMLLDRLCGSHIYLVPRRNPFLTHLKPRMEQLAQQINTASGEDSYLIPVGGSNKTGLFGYITVFEELMQQGALDNFDDLVFACGSGGTATGLALGNYLTNGKLRLHAIAVSDNATYFYDHCDETLAEVGMAHLNSRDLMRVIDGHKGKGYGISTEDELEFIQQVAMETAILLDPVYSGKTALGMVREIHNNPGAFQGRRVLFLHTGGIFGLFDGRMTPFLEQKQEQEPLIKMWPEVNDCPL